MLKSLIALLFTTTIYGSTLTVNPKRTINISGVVDNTIRRDAEALIKLSEKSKDPVYLIINSPGGSVLAGQLFIDAMTLVKHRGITINCVTTVYAASMAFNFLLHCSERYVFEHAKLLYHPARIAFGGSSPVTAKELARYSNELTYIDNGLKELLHERAGMTKLFIEQTYYLEKWWTPKQLMQYTKPDLFKIIKDVKGYNNIFVLDKSSSLKQLRRMRGVIIHAKDN